MPIHPYHHSNYFIQLQMKDEEIFQQALKWHQSGLRFLKAGFYVDSIHSLLEGFQILEGLLGQHDLSLTQDSSPHTPVTLPCHCLEPVDVIRMPIDDSFEFREAQGRMRRLRGCPLPYHFDLLVTMTYNLALAFHLHANQLHDPETFISMLRQSKNLYMQARRLHELYGSDVLNTNTLENNLLHLQYMLQLESQKTPVVFPTLQTSPSKLNMATHAA